MRAAEIMKTPDAKQFLAALDDGTRKRYLTAVAAIDQGTDAGQIMNPVFQDAKRNVNDALSTGWGALVNGPFFHAGKWETIPETIRKGLWMVYPQAHVIPSHIKRIEALPDHPAKDAALYVLRTVAPVAAKLQALKTKIVKRQPKAPGEGKEKYLAPHVGSEAVKRIRDVFQKVVADHYEELVSAFEGFFQRTVKEYLDAQAAGKAKDYWKFFKYPAESMVAGMFLVQGDYKDRDAGRHYVAMKDVAAAMRRQAEKDAAQLRDAFIYKNLKKIASVVDAKGNFTEIVQIGSSVDLSGLHGEFLLSFKDGSNFEIRNKSVYVVNNYGTRFVRYPLTFHSVELPGGKKMKQPSEQRMNEIFAKA